MANANDIENERHEHEHLARYDGTFAQDDKGETPFRPKWVLRFFAFDHGTISSK